MSTSSPAPSESAPARTEAVRRLLHSEPFVRSRRFADRLDTDPVLLEELLDLVRLRRVENDPRLAPLAERIARAVDWLSGPARAGDDSAALMARRRMTLAALCYLVEFDDVIPDGVLGGTVDDHIVLDVILSQALDPEAT